MITLGDRVKDRVTGVVGIATAKVEYLNGCVQFAVEPKIAKGGKLVSHYIDEGQLEKLRGGLKETRSSLPKPRGGPQGHRTPPGASESRGTDADEYSEEA